jgi:CheY-like chemotaxis protein
VPLPTRRFDILLIEDSEADVGLTVAAFRDALVYAHVHCVRDGEEAMDFLRHAGEYAHATRPDLVILDLSLPKGSGFDVLEEMKADPKLKSIPVIVMSGSDREKDQARA